MVTEATNVIAIIPMKPLTLGKSRLAQELTAEQRADLVLGMLRRVVLAIKAASVDTVWVVGGDDRVRDLTESLGGECVPELGTYLNDTLKKAFELAFEQGKSALFVAGDLPNLDAPIHNQSGYGRNDRHGTETFIGFHSTQCLATADVVPCVVQYIRHDAGEARSNFGNASRISLNRAGQFNRFDNSLRPGHSRHDSGISRNSVRN